MSTLDLNNSECPTIVIGGLTGSGKSSIALRLAEELPVEIVNADSVQLYSELDIGSAKPSAADFEKVPHHLYSILSPETPFDVARFVTIARERILEIKSRGVIPVVVGGTGLYVETLLTGLSQVPEVPAEVRRSVGEELQRIRNATKSKIEYEKAIAKLMQKVDPEMAEILHPSDTQRISRAMEVKLSTGKSLKEHWKEQEKDPLPGQVLVFSFLPERKALYASLDERVEAMLAAGMLAEVQAIIERWGPRCPSLDSIGYRHIRSVVQGELCLDEAITDMKRDTRRFSKRQRTWWRNRPGSLSWKVISSECSSSRFAMDSEGRYLAMSQILHRNLERGLSEKDTSVALYRLG